MSGNKVDSELDGKFVGAGLGDLDGGEIEGATVQQRMFTNNFC